MRYSQVQTLSVLTLCLAATVSTVAMADDMLIPRLGYQEGAPAKIYLDIVSPKTREAQAKAKKQEEKAAHQAEEANKKLAQKTKSIIKDDPEIMQIRPLDPQNTAPPAASTPAQAQPTEKPKLTKAQQKEAKEEEAREKAETQRVKRNRERMQALYDQHMNMPVDGAFYLYSLKNDQILYHEAEFPKPAPLESIAPYYVEFKEKPSEGLYDVAVKGSGHLSELPLVVSDAIYWDALKPVANAFSKAHCPLTDGKYQIVQQCYELSVFPGLKAVQAKTPTEDQKAQLIQGGWYSPPSSDMVKSTANIANMAQILLEMYEINPKSFKYLEIPGDNYEQSAYPDVLDEANWGLQYLLSVQQPDGTFPRGIREYEAGENTLYYFVPSASEANARAVMALATAARVFRHEDLSLSVKFMRAAEKGWQAFQKTQNAMNPEWVMLASNALAQAGDDPVYAQTFEKAKAMVDKLTPETALLLGDAGKDLPVQEIAYTGTPKEFATVLPWVVELQRRQRQHLNQLASWVTDLFGYERVTFKKDDDLEEESPQKAPMQWLAGKTGETADRVNSEMKEALGHKDVKTESANLKALEEQETKAKDRVQKGYDEMALSSQDNIYLAYTLALLNQQATPEFDPNTPHKSKPRKEYIEPMGNPRGYWPKAI